MDGWLYSTCFARLMIVLGLFGFYMLHIDSLTGQEFQYKVCKVISGKFLHQNRSCDDAQRHRASWFKPFPGGDGVCGLF